ncbi:MAG: Rieske 2Fe-2S domain-containing protein [Candidatus Diapherotrites archaeon]|nr:Rieske 2Fe-2S domain-containing protein [Candidatus Diapherotrites archaeon]
MGFVEVCSVGDVPDGEGRTFTANGNEIAVFNVGGEFNIISNVCAHKGGPLGEGILDGATVSCPWHQWKYDVTTGKSATSPNICVAKFNSKIENGKVFVEL